MEQSKAHSDDAKADLSSIFTSHLANGTVDLGIKYFTEFVTRNPSHGLAWFLLGRLREAAGDFSKAYIAFNKSMLVTEHNLEIPLEFKVKRALEVARFCLKNNWPRRASNHVNTALLMDPHNASALRLKAECGTEQRNAHQLTRDQTRKGKLAADTKPPAKDESELSRANEAFARGQLGLAKEFYHLAIEKQPQRSAAYVGLASTYARLGDIPAMEQILTKAAKLQTDNEYAILHLLGTAYAKQGKPNEVIAVYERALQLAKNDSQKVGPYQWIGNAYGELGDKAKAREAYEAALAIAPTNIFIQSMLARLDKGDGLSREPHTVVGSGDLSTVKEEDPRGWGDEEIEQEPTLTEMLNADRDRLEWTDSTIIARGGIVRPEDAHRLLVQARRAGADFNARALLFLEAAKAFGALTTSERIPAQQEEALQRFASQKGGFFLLQLVGEAKKRTASQGDRLARLRDSTCAYYTEAMKIQQFRQPKFMLLILLKYLQAILIAAAPDESESIYRSNLSRLLERVGRDRNDLKLLTAVARGLLELGRTQMGLVRLAFDSPDVRIAITQHGGGWRSALTNLGATEGQSLARALRSIIDRWKENVRKATSTFSRIYTYPVTLSNIRDLRNGLQELDSYDGVFCDTDRTILSQISAEVLDNLVKYNDLPASAAAERNLLAAQVREAIARLRNGIREYPTYWTRVMFDPLLLTWEHLLGKAEHARLAEVRPALSVRLETQKLPVSEKPQGVVFSVSNSGQATASNCTMELETGTETAAACVINSIQPGRTATARFVVTVPADAIREKYFEIRYRIGFDRPDGRENSAWFEDVVYIGNFAPIKINPFMDGPPVEDPVMFKGRDEIMSQIIHKLKSDDRVRSTLLFGITRTGKTSILKHLKRNTAFMKIQLSGSKGEYSVLPLLISFDKCARDTAPDFFFSLFSTITTELDFLVEEHSNVSNVPHLEPNTLPRSMTGLEDVIYTLYKKRFYPLFLIDEFSIYRTLFDKQVLDATFLSRLRHFALDEGKATFLFAGTYDLKKLTSDPAYGITGQLVSTDQIQVGRISDQAASDLIRVINEQLLFSDSAVERILDLSGRIPYFIQLVCKNCVYYANHFETPVITHMEVESVVDRLTARQEEIDRTLPVQPISAGAFQANVWSESDSPISTAVVSALCFQAHAGASGTYFRVDELENYMRYHRAVFTRRGLLDELEHCTDKQIVDVQRHADGSSGYRLSVDLFRRWFVRRYNVEWSIGRVREDK